MISEEDRKLLEVISKPENRDAVRAITMITLLESEIKEKQAELRKQKKILADWKAQQQVK